MREPRKPEKRLPKSALAGARAKTPRRRNPDVEISIGLRIRHARLAANISQGALGKAAGITFQQVQKYENGMDRVAASTLQIFASVLGVNPASFYDSSEPVMVARGRATNAVMKTAMTIEKIRDPAVRQRLLALAAAIVATQDGDA